MPLLIKIFLEKDLDNVKERRYKEIDGGEDRGKEGERAVPGEVYGPQGSVPATTSHSSSSSNSSSNSNSSSSSSSRSSITSSSILHIFDSDMIQLVMQDVIGMTSHGISTFTTQPLGGSLERISSQDRDGEKDKEGESKDGYSRIDAEERAGEDLEKSGKRDLDKDSSSVLSDASGLRIELLKVLGPLIRMPNAFLLYSPAIHFILTILFSFFFSPILILFLFYSSPLLHSPLFSPFKSF